MLFVNIYKIKSSISEAEDKRLYQLLAKWQPPAGLKILGWWVRADGTGVNVSETDSAEAVIEGLAPWYYAIDFDVQPAVEIAKGSEIANKAIAWRESVR
jgi:hypothetical protein